jgi:predicted transcriptional regulator
VKKVKDVMNEDLKLVKATTPLSELVEIFTEQGMTGAPVVDHQEQLIGLVSCTDVARHWVEVSAGPGSHNAADFTAQDVMTPFLLNVSPEDPVAKVVELMCSGGIHRTVVTELGVPVGIVTTMDLMKDYRRLLDAHTTSP